MWAAGIGIVFACRSWVWSLGDVAWSLSVVWWSWVEESSNVTPCDIHEITCRRELRSLFRMLYYECLLYPIFSLEKFVMSAFFIKKFVVSSFNQENF